MSLVPIEHSQGVKTRADADDDRRNPTRARHISQVMVPARSHASICQAHFLRYIHILTSSLFSGSEESKQRKWATHGKSVLGVAREMPNAMPFGLASSRSLALSLTSNPCPFFCKKRGDRRKRHTLSPRKQTDNDQRVGAHEEVFPACVFGLDTLC